MGKRSAARKKQKAPPARPRRRALPLLLFVAAVLLFANTLGHEFVFDDVTLIVQNPLVTGLQWGELAGFHSYRPVRTLTYMVNYWLGGAEPFGYHLVNVLLHGLNVVLVFRFLERLGGTAAWAGWGALFFAVHPVQTAAVAYVSGRKDLLATLFLLGGLLVYLAYREKPRPALLVLAFLLFVLGVLSKEVALVFPGLMLLTDLYRNRIRGKAGGLGNLAASVRRFWWLYLVLVALAAAGVLYSVEVLEASRIEGVWGDSWTANWGTSFKLFQHYLLLVVFPYPLRADYLGEVFPVSAGFGEPATLLAVLLAAAYGAAAVWASRRQPAVSFGMLWFALALLPVLQLIPFHELAADHFLYLPLVGAAFLVGFAMDALVRSRRWKTPATVTVGILCALYAAVSFDRNRDWKDKESLWTATLEAAPGSYRAHCNLGGIAQQQRDLERALRLTQRCLELDPSRTLPYSNLGGIHRDLGSQALAAGRLEEAEEHLDQAVEYSLTALRMEDSPWTRSNLADAYKDLALLAQRRGEGRREVSRLRRMAADEFERAIARAQGSEVLPVLIYKLGAVYLDAGNYPKALELFLQCVDSLRGWPLAQAATGFAFLQVGEYEQSIEYFGRALRMQPSVDAYVGLAHAQESLGRTAAARETLASALQLFPANPEILYHLGRLHLETGELQQARSYLLLALQASPSAGFSQSVRLLLEKSGAPGAGGSG